MNTAAFEPKDLLKIRFMTLIANAILVVGYFIPSLVFRVAYIFDVKIAFSGLNLTFGKTVMGERITGFNFFGLLLLLLPVAGIVLTFVRMELSEKNRALINVVLAAAYILILIIYAAALSHSVQEEAGGFASMSVTFMFVLDVIAAAVVIFLELLVFLGRAGEETYCQDAVQALANGGSAAGPVWPSNCPNCGAPVARGDKFCTSCGQKIVPIMPAPQQMHAPFQGPQNGPYQGPQNGPYQGPVNGPQNGPENQASWNGPQNGQPVQNQQNTFNGQQNPYMNQQQNPYMQQNQQMPQNAPQAPQQTAPSGMQQQTSAPAAASEQGFQQPSGGNNTDGQNGPTQ